MSNSLDDMHLIDEIMKLREENEELRKQEKEEYKKAIRELRRERINKIRHIFLNFISIIGILMVVGLIGLILYTAYKEIYHSGYKSVMSRFYDCDTKCINYDFSAVTSSNNCMCINESLGAGPYDLEIIRIEQIQGK